MRLVLSNPHIHYYGKVVAKTLMRLENHFKYSYVMDYYIKNKERPTAFLIDGTRSSFNELGVRFRVFPKFFAYLELLVWMLINGLNPLKHKIYFNVKKINPKEDILLNFSFTTLDSFNRNNDQLQFHKYPGLVVTHLSHYLAAPKMLNTYFKKIKYNFLVSENDLTMNDYFQHYFPNIKEVYHLPFCFSDRFKDIRKFSDRKNKCLGLGTFSTGKSKDFCDFFGDGVNLQPMRKIIYDNQEDLKAYIDCYMHNFDNDRLLHKISPKDSLKMRLAKKYLPYFILMKILPNRQREYLSFDVVEKHNEHKMFVCPEELIGVPSTNVFEGMACGTVFFGIDDPMYTALGMKDGVNYVTYKKDSLDDFIEKIRYWQKHPKELEQIGKNGRDFVTARFRQDKIANIFWKDLEKLLDSFKADKPKFVCSFKRLES